MEKCCGLTGGIGSGKSAAADYFQIWVSTRMMLRELAVVEPGQPALEKRRALWFKHPDPHGQLDRAALRKKVFSDVAEQSGCNNYCTL